MRKITYQNEKGAQLLTEYKDLSKSVAGLTDQITKLEEERNKVAIKGQKVKDKLNIIVQKLTKEDEGEFEVVTKVETSDGKDVMVEFTDMLEEWKKAYKERNKK